MISKAEAIALGARDLAIPQSGLRPESFEYLRGGGKPIESLPVTIVWYPDGKRAIQDGRHRITIARERGEPFVHGRIIAYGPRLGRAWSYTGRIAV